MLSLVENLFLKNPLQDLLSSLNAVISTNEKSTESITGHVIYNLAYTYLQIPTENHLCMCISMVQNWKWLGRTVGNNTSLKKKQSKTIKSDKKPIQFPLHNLIFMNYNMSRLYLT